MTWQYQHPRPHRSSNDHHIDFSGKLRGGLEPEIDEMLEHREKLNHDIQNKLEETGMLKGTGFVVIDPSEPRFSGEEIVDLQEAHDAANNICYQSRSGMAIVYAPVAILRPKRDVAISSPTKLMKQLIDGASQVLPDMTGQDVTPK